MLAMLPLMLLLNTVSSVPLSVNLSFRTCQCSQQHPCEVSHFCVLGLFYVFKAGAEAQEEVVLSRN